MGQFVPFRSTSPPSIDYDLDRDLQARIRERRVVTLARRNFARSFFSFVVLREKEVILHLRLIFDPRQTILFRSRPSQETKSSLDRLQIRDNRDAWSNLAINGYN